ncbi:MAG: SUMF1/EgtB/PvdO family nonheme iron enzyme [Kouleothrix sp.]|nr:SUMF1/EgtB/PvdO family nonheme iron enzyme [Kouleothrix sp.]
MSDPAAQLDFLRTQRDAAPDAAARAMFEQLIAAIESQPTRAHSTAIGDSAQVGVSTAGDVHGSVVAPLFPAGASGNYIAGVINLYQHSPTVTAADYEAALRRYLDDLYARHSTLDLRGIDEQGPVEIQLADLYISLTLREPALASLRGRDAVRRLMTQPADPHPADAGLAGEAQRTVAWSEALRDHPRLAVIGRPGSGKTTLLHYTAIRLAESLARDDRTRLDALGVDAPLVPLLLPLRELGSYLRECRPRDLSGNGPRLLLDCLANYADGRNLDLPADFFSTLCAQGRAILLLDGLDEVSRADDREIVSAIVREFAQRYPACRYVATARVAAYTGAAEIGAGFAVCTVDDLNDEQQGRFIANWSRCIHRRIYPKGGADQIERMAATFDAALAKAIRDNRGVGRLAPNPLLLTVIAIVFYNHQDLPENRAQLYEECVKVLLRGGRGKVDTAGKERAALLMGLDARRELLAAVAYHMHCSGEEHKLIDRDALERLIATYLRPRTPGEIAAAELARAFLNELPVHIGLLDEVEQNRFGFSHLSFQEFLAARHVAETDRWDAALDHYLESWWREVILLCAGHLSQVRCWNFLARLAARGDTADERAAALALAGDALTELERFKGQGPIRGQVRDAALELLERQPPDALPAAARVQCGYTLARVGDPRPGVCDLPPALVELPGGSFTIGSTPEQANAAGIAYERFYREQGDEATAQRARRWPEDEINSQPLQLPAFAIGRYPVTNAQYKLFLDDGGYDLAQPWWDAAARAWLARDDAATEGLQEWQRRTRKDQPEWWDHDLVGIARPNYPVVGVSWYEARAFCDWLTRNRAHNPEGYVYVLPSEAEWEYVARGVKRRTYSWGEPEPDGERANFNQIYKGTTAVGCFPSGATPEGVLDLAGNVWEWTRSEYRDYPYDLDDGRERPDDPADKYFTLRGGGWDNQSIDLRASYRFNNTPDYHNGDVGFRLARHPPV